MFKKDNPNKTYQRSKKFNNNPEEVVIDFGDSKVTFDLVENFDGEVSLVDPNTKEIVVTYNSMDSFFNSLNRFKDNRR